MNDLKCSFIWTDIIHGKDGSNFVDPSVKIVGNTTINSFLNVGLNLVYFQVPGLKRGKRLVLLDVVMLKFVILLVKKRIKLITGDIIINVEVLKYFLDL
jgi:hypothetical protein